jgi:hypothetical protein
VAVVTGDREPGSGRRIVVGDVASWQCEPVTPDNAVEVARTADGSDAPTLVHEPVRRRAVTVPPGAPRR